MKGEGGPMDRIFPRCRSPACLMLRLAERISHARSSAGVGYTRAIGGIAVAISFNRRTAWRLPNAGNSILQYSDAWQTEESLTSFAANRATAGHSPVPRIHHHRDHTLCPFNQCIAAFGCDTPDFIHVERSQPVQFKEAEEILASVLRGLEYVAAEHVDEAYDERCIRSACRTGWEFHRTIPNHRLQHADFRALRE